jgi:ribosomal protein L37AE/L43A
VIHSLFTEPVAAQIYGLPLSSMSQPDRLLWKGTTHGCFSVRSAYYMEMARREQEIGECSQAGEQQDIWKLIWKLKVLAMLKNFAWKVGANLLPTKTNMVSRRIGDDPYCPICTSTFETISHIIWECPSSTAVWQECSK